MRDDHDRRGNWFPDRFPARLGFVSQVNLESFLCVLRMFPRFSLRKRVAVCSNDVDRLFQNECGRYGDEREDRFSIPLMGKVIQEAVLNLAPLPKILSMKFLSAFVI